jgi:hypothetical protein
VSRQYRAFEVVLFRGWKWKIVAVDFSHDPEWLDIVALDSSTSPNEIRNIPVTDVTFVPEVIA